MFKPHALAFLRGLARNNRKEWFEAHRAEYEAEVLAPLRELVEEMDVRLAELCPEIVGDPKRSLFRIHRDVRFSKDKSPYKTQAACWFYHRDAGRGVGGSAHGGAGFYFHLAPDECLLAGGFWAPPRAALNAIREALVEDTQGFERAVGSDAFKRSYRELDDELMLQRLPRGFAAGHPAERWLRYQSFTASRSLTEREVCSAKLPDTLARHYETLVPLVRWLNKANGWSAAERR